MRNLSPNLIFEKNLTQSDGVWLILASVDLNYSVTVTNITKAPDAIVTASNHNLLSGQTATFINVGGMTEINNLDPAEVTYIDENTFAVDIDSSGFSDYVSGGTAQLALLRFVRNTEDVIFGGETYLAFPFEIDNTLHTSEGEIPSIKIRLSNVTRLIQPYLEALNGAVSSTITITVVNSKHLSEDYSELEMTFSVLDFQEVVHQKRNILQPGSQRRYLDRDDAETVKKVFTKLAFFGLLF